MANAYKIWWDQFPLNSIKDTVYKLNLKRCLPYHRDLLESGQINIEIESLATPIPLCTAKVLINEAQSAGTYQIGLAIYE